MKISNFKFQISKLRQGFTMIELLIVIAVLGVLAIAVLSAINPIEQIDKGRDTGDRSDSEQLLSAIDRFYASLQYYPWQDTVGSTQNVGLDTGLLEASAVIVYGNSPPTMLENLENTAEVKGGFKARLTSRKKVYLYFSVTDNSAYACFIPASLSFTTEAYNACKSETQVWGTGLDDLACSADCINAATPKEAKGECYVCL